MSLAETRQKLIPAVLISLLLPAACWAQESRGSIAGRVIDPQGAVIPGANVTVANTDTNATTRSATNAAGYFEVNLLNPGNYSVTVESAGFRRLVRTGLVLNVGSQLNLEFTLEVGDLAQSLEVTAEAPLLDTSSAAGGRIVDQRQIMQLPIADMNPFTMAALAAGMQWTGNPGFRRPSDVGGTSSFNTMGGVGQNEYTIDGAPVTGTNRRVGFVPPSDAINEFKLETTSFDVTYGHTSGAAINVVTKSGTNAFHGSLYDQHWQQRWNATPHFVRLAFDDAVRRGERSPDDQKQASGRSNYLGGSLGGPILKDKAFFFLSYNGHFESKWDSSSPNRTVPKMAWREGDFSDLLAVDPVKYTIYDPRSARQEGNRVVRLPFPGNRGVPVLNPIYDYYTAIFPRPNDVPGLVSPEGFDNYFASQTVDTLKYHSLVNRYDYIFNDRHRASGRWQWSRRTPNTRDWAYETIPGLLTQGSHRINHGAGANYTWLLSSATLLDINASWARFNEGSRSEVRAAIKPSDVGLPAYLDEKAGDLHTLPLVDFSDIEDLSFDYPAIASRGANAELRVGLSTLKGRHSLKYGFSERRYWFTSASPGYTSGRFTFSNAYTREADDTRTAAGHGLDWAAFMMGLPSGISIDTADSGYWSTRARAFYFQDDWRITDRLRISLGLRYEREGGITERFNRGLSGEFVADAKLPFTDIAQSVYASNPLAELPASEFRVLGGTRYLGQGSKTFTDGTHHLLPRASVVFQLDRSTVLRTGYGWYYDSFNANNTRPSQHGYSLTTNTTVSNDNGLTFTGVGAAGNLSAGSNPLLDPFPVRADGTRFDLPYGGALGLVARAGSGHTFYSRDYSPARQQRWRIGVQREITSRMILDVSYNGSYSTIPVNQPINFLPRQYWATGNTRNQAVDDDLNGSVPNPFRITHLAPLETTDPLAYQYLGTVGFFTGSTVRKNQLLRPYPHMGSLNGVRPGLDFADTRGGNWYHDLQVQFERRFSRGFQTSLMYTYANSSVQDVYLNEFDLEPSWQPSNQIRPHRFVWAAIWELPFGRGRTWLQTGPLQHVVGGWQLSWVYQYQSGPATNWGNYFFYGDTGRLESLFDQKNVHSRDIHVWFDPSIAYRGSGAVPDGFVGFEGRSSMQPGQYHTRVFPTRLDTLRADGIRNWDVKILRKFAISERLSTSFSVDLLNATNHTNFGAPNTNPTNQNFGRVTSQNGLPRRLQFNLRIDF